jgi:hypothetical protein
VSPDSAGKRKNENRTAVSLDKTGTAVILFQKVLIKRNRKRKKKKRIEKIMKLFAITLAAMMLSAGTLCAAEPAQKAAAKAPAAAKAKCSANEQKNDAAPVRQNQNIIKRATGKVLDQQKKRDQQLIDQGLL